MDQSIIESTLAGSETLVRFKAGETLFREGDEPRGVLVVRSGQIDLIFSARNGDAKALRVAQPGQILGMSCLVTDRPHDCTATARTAGEAGFVRRADFMRTLDQCPAVWFSVLRVLSNDINAAYDDIRALVAR